MKNYLLILPLMTASLVCSCKETKTTAVPDEAPEGSRSPATKEQKVVEKKAWPPSGETVDADLLKENYLVVLDDSGSMAGGKIGQAKEVLMALAKTLPPEHNLGLVRLNHPQAVELGPGNRDDFSKAVAATQASGGTPLRAVTAKAYEVITKKASAQRGYGSYHMIIVTDGESSDGSAMPLVTKMVSETAIQVHVIGFHLENHEMNQPDLVDYQAAGSSRELAQAFESVTAEAEEFTDPKAFSR